MSFELNKNAFSNYVPNQILFLVEFSHSEFKQTYFITNNTSNILVNNNTYEPFPFVFNIPAQGETQGSNLTLSNIDRQITQEISSIILSNENILAQIHLCLIEDNTPEVFNLGLFEIFTSDISKETVILGINQRVSLGFNVGTIRYSQRLFSNLYL